MPGMYGTGRGTVLYRPWMPSRSLKFSVTDVTRIFSSPSPGVRRVDVVELQDVTRRAVLVHSPGLHDNVLQRIGAALGIYRGSPTNTTAPAARCHSRSGTDVSLLTSSRYCMTMGEASAGIRDGGAPAQSRRPRVGKR